MTARPHWWWLFICFNLVVLFTTARRLGESSSRKLVLGTSGNVIPNQYIVVFNKRVNAESAINNIPESANGMEDAPSILYEYTSSFNGAAIQGLSKSDVDMLAQNEYIEQIIEVSKTVIPSAVESNTYQL